MEKECYEEEVQPYRKMDYKPIIYIYIIYNRKKLIFLLMLLRLQGRKYVAFSTLPIRP